MITSGGPISVAKPFPESGWSAEDAAWELLQRAAIDALRSGDRRRASQQTEAALALAREHFRTGDPRLAASFATKAWLVVGDRPALADTLFREALAHWHQATTWLAAEPPPLRLARSSPV